MTCFHRVSGPAPSPVVCRRNKNVTSLSTNQVWLQLQLRGCHLFLCGPLSTRQHTATHEVTTRAQAKMGNTPSTTALVCASSAASEINLLRPPRPPTITITSSLELRVLTSVNRTSTARGTERGIRFGHRTCVSAAGKTNTH